MKTYYARKYFKKYRKQDPDYLVYPKETGKNTENKCVVGRVYKNRGTNGIQYLKIDLFDEE